MMMGSAAEYVLGQMYNLVEMAKENGIDPYAYWAWLLKTAPDLELSEHPQRAEQLLSVCFQQAIINIV